MHSQATRIYLAREIARERRREIRAAALLVSILTVAVGFIAAAMLMLSGSYAAHVPYAQWYAQKAPWFAGAVFVTSMIVAACVFMSWRSSYRASLQVDRRSASNK